MWGHFAGQRQREDGVGARAADVQVGDAHAAVGETFVDEREGRGGGGHGENGQILHCDDAVLRGPFAEKWR